MVHAPWWTCDALDQELKAPDPDIRAANGRVHVVVRSAAGGTRVVAVCEPALRERVERALAQARFALAGRAVRVEAVR